ncbi:MAG: helix-turn-helix domain-containing protein [Chloroflexi bacterium]|nr:helix-turn-helix domain-containing protein [Chloroflexota bacterium]
MTDIGQLLRQTREAQELSLADVEEQTRIRQRYLSALETGDWDDMPNDVVARGFLRTYTRFLGLDDDEVLSQLDAAQPPTTTDAATTDEAVTEAVATPGYHPIELDLYENSIQRSQRMRRWLGFGLSLIPVIILAYLIYQFALPLLLDRSDRSGAAATPVATLPPEGTPPATPQIVIVDAPASPLPTSSPTPDATTATTPESTSTPESSPTPTTTATPAQQLILDMNVVLFSWVQISTDGEIVEEALLREPYQGRYVAYTQLELLTGNAAGLELTLNGEPLPPLGEPGEIVALIWTLEGDDIVVTTPTPEPEVTEPPPTPLEPGAGETATATAETPPAEAPPAEGEESPTAE